MPKLVIVESPTKAKTLAKYLPKEYEIKASMGHVRDLPKSGLGVDVDHGFEPYYVINEKSAKVLGDLRRSASKADQIILATDPDREGEAISWHLHEILTGKLPLDPAVYDEAMKALKIVTKNKKKLPKDAKELRKAKKIDTTILFSKSPDSTFKLDPKYGRVVFHELTKSAIADAFANIGPLNVDLVDAQQARRILDRLVGYKLSPLLWKKVRYGLSAGRVQSVAVRLIVERERERQAFVPEEYWSVASEFCDKKGARQFTADLFEIKGKKAVVSNAKTADKIKTELANDSFLIEAVKKTERKKNPYAPLKTSGLQQSMANVFAFSAKRTMDAAQKLFEKGFITYHRTDSLNLSPQFIERSREFIKDEFGAKYLPAQANLYKTKAANAQEAHEAIRPTEVTRLPSQVKLSDDEDKVYTVIWRRAIECQMEAALYDQTTISILSEKGYGFRATGSIIRFDGWLAVDKMLHMTEDEESEVAKILPEYTEQEFVDMTNLQADQHFTQPPPRYSDATLIKQMEELSVGRPSTYAPTIQTIQARGYVQREGRYFSPTDVAFVVTDLLVKHFPETVDYGFTAKMEEELDEIAEGKRNWVPVIKEFYGPLDKQLKIKDKELNKTDVTNLGESDEKCPKCGKTLIYKLGKYGKFLSCSDYPTCDFAKPIVIKDEVSSLVDENDAKEPEKDYGMCDKCNQGKMIAKQGRFGKFLACERYPECKNTKPLLTKIGISCPKCTAGDVVVRFARKRKFFGCSTYPECDWSSWKAPVKDENGNLFFEAKPETSPADTATKRTKKAPKKAATPTV